ncbi:MAG: hypothetical protein BYD32DRAFT_460336 [Podila humilis]|nr:MAG: hypothetical protein BYD32DRAFT_460336 [Podila humilis]
MASVLVSDSFTAGQDDGFDVDCWTCINNNMHSVSICKALSLDFNPLATDPTSTEPHEYACVCRLATNLSWLTSCRSMPSCKGSFMTTLEQTNGIVVRDAFSCPRLLAQKSLASLTMDQRAGGMALTLITVAQTFL